MGDGWGMVRASTHPTLASKSGGSRSTGSRRSIERIPTNRSSTGSARVWSDPLLQQEKSRCVGTICRALLARGWFTQASALEEDTASIAMSSRRPPRTRGLNGSPGNRQYIRVRRVRDFTHRWVTGGEWCVRARTLRLLCRHMNRRVASVCELLKSHGSAPRSSPRTAPHWPHPQTPGCGCKCGQGRSGRGR